MNTVAGGVLSRKLIKETLNRETNHYQKLANISFDKNDMLFSYDNLVYDSEIDAALYCQRAEDLFELYQHCANRKEIESICAAYLRSLEATKLSVNWHLYDDAKQREKMTEEFYSAVKKEIAEYQDRANYLIQSSSQSPAIMDRWVLKIEALEVKKKHYEEVLRRELSGVNDEFATLKFLGQELKMRAQKIRFQKAA